MQKEILKQCCHKCDDYSKSWEVTCRDCECHQPNMKTKSTKECCKECKRLNNATSMMSGESALICVDDHCPFCHQPPQSKVKATCLSLDCPERTGGECRHQPPQSTQESWEKELDKKWNLYNDGKSFGFTTCGEEVKSFIRHLLSNSKQETLDEIKEILIEARTSHQDNCEQKPKDCHALFIVSDLIYKIKNIK